MYDIFLFILSQGNPKLLEFYYQPLRFEELDVLFM